MSLLYNNAYTFISNLKTYTEDFMSFGYAVPTTALELLSIKSKKYPLLCK